MGGGSTVAGAVVAATVTGAWRPDDAKGEQVSETTPVATYVDAETHVLSACNGVDYAYRTTGASDATRLVRLQRFRGNLDNCDAALIDALAGGRRVITFDNRGVAASSGTTPNTIAQMALDAIDFIDALGVGEVDLLGFSIGSFLAQARLFGSAGSERHARLGA